MSDFVFGTATELPDDVVKTGRRGRSPFESPLIATLNNESTPWATVVVPTGEVSKISQRIRAVGGRLKLGVSIRMVHQGGDQTTVYFQAFEREPKSDNSEESDK